MKQVLICLILLGLASSCEKDESHSKGGFVVQVPSFVKGTTPIRVDFSTLCDTPPHVSFTTENGALGVVSMTENMEFETSYIYSGEEIPVSFENGRAQASFWYVPLSSGKHAVSFHADYTENGVKRTGTNRQVLKVSNAANGNFNIEVKGFGYFSLGFNNLFGKNIGCDVRICLNKTSYPATGFYLAQSGGSSQDVELGQFYTFKCSEWWGNQLDVADAFCCAHYQSLSSPITLYFTFRDDFCRCRDVVVNLGGDGNLVSYETGEYYLWPHTVEEEFQLF